MINITLKEEKMKQIKLENSDTSLYKPKKSVDKNKSKIFYSSEIQTIICRESSQRKKVNIKFKKWMNCQQAFTFRVQIQLLGNWILILLLIEVHIDIENYFLSSYLIISK